MGGLVGLFRLLRNRNSLHFSLLPDPSIHPPGGTPLDTDDGCDGGMDFCCANAEAKSKPAATPIWRIFPGVALLYLRKKPIYLPWHLGFSLRRCKPCAWISA